MNKSYNYNRTPGVKYWNIFIDYCYYKISCKFIQQLSIRRSVLGNNNERYATLFWRKNTVVSLVIP